MSTLLELEAALTMTPEDDRVFAWRSEQFQRLGFSTEMSWLLAGSDADLSQGRSLVAAGCTLQLALQILL